MISALIISRRVLAIDASLAFAVTLIDVLEYLNDFDYPGYITR